MGKDQYDNQSRNAQYDFYSDTQSGQDTISLDRQPTVELHGIRGQSFNMDERGNVSTLQRIIGNNRLDRPVAEDGDVRIYPMVINKDKLLYLWRQSIKHKALFWHPALTEYERFVEAMTSPGWVFFEVYKNDYLCGFVYFTGVDHLEHIQMHAIFFDRKLTDKLEVGKQLIQFMFDQYPLERIEAAIADKFHATHRFVQKLGFRYEGSRRRGVLLAGKFVDQRIFSVIRED